MCSMSSTLVVDEVVELHSTDVGLRELDVFDAMANHNAGKHE